MLRVSASGLTVLSFSPACHRAMGSYVAAYITAESIQMWTKRVWPDSEERLAAGMRP